MDGDCGIDVACQMLGLAQTPDQRTCLREKISDYLVDRVREPWMHDLMVALQEVLAEEVNAYRSCGPGSIGGEASASADASQGAPTEAAEAAVADDGAAAEAAPVFAAPSGDALEALKWATGLKENSILVALAMSLPPAVLEEQQRLQKAAVAVAERPAETPKLQLLVNPDMLRSRMQVAEAFHAQLLEEGEWSPGKRVPRNAAKRFIATLMWKKKVPVKTQRAMVLKWFRYWENSVRLQKPQLRCAISKRGASANKIVANHSRRRAPGQGRLFACPWVRQELYEWFVAMRYSIDWKACEQSLPRSSGRKNALGASRGRCCDTR